MPEARIRAGKSPGERVTSIPAAVPFRTALWWWLKLGCISFGGPAGQIAIMHRELVETRRWISEARFLHALNYCTVLPGPEAQQLATYIGWLMHGVRGGLAAGVLFVLPSLLLLVVLTGVYMSLDARTAADALYGVRPAVVAIVALAAWRIAPRVLRQRALWPLPLLAFGALLANVAFPWVIGLAAVYGVLMRRPLAPASRTHGEVRHHAPALIDDHTPPPAHARVSPRMLLAVLGTGVVLGAAVVGSLSWLGAPVFLHMAQFFGQAALVTFGGAYAVMPYVFQGAVHTYGWLTPAQMIDGLALGETTPGPLIMVVAFIGFVGGWTQAGGDPLAAGVIGACVATFFTFLPSFVFIFAGAPWVERTRNSLHLHAPLSAITAAVLGAMAALALFFAAQVFWPRGEAGGVDAMAVALAVLGAIALWRNWLGIVPLIALSAVIGGASRVL